MILHKVEIEIGAELNSGSSGLSLVTLLSCLYHKERPTSNIEH